MASLPLKERATEHHPYFRILPADAPARPVRPATGLIPLQAPQAGEQYRFHFDMTKCIGCHCCEVACNEQNNLPADQHWRRVGEVEGGVYPWAERFYLSMGCNHCVEPSCLLGCPVEAYTKDSATGIVLHSADTCIGCQYCIWNCPYGVPQFNPERGVVGKCDLCHGRLRDGDAPACVQACPEEAIRVETVNVAQWREDYALSANAPGMPAAELTISTTRLTLPERLPVDIDYVDHHRVRPEHPHWPLVFMTVLTQLSVGAFAGLWGMHVTGRAGSLGLAAVMALVAGHVSLLVSTLHLGRPIYAYRALKMWRRSWLSREVLLFTLFAITSAAYAPMLWWDVTGHDSLGMLTLICGLAGIGGSAALYLVPARPAWNSGYTVADYYLTAALLGPVLLMAVGVADPVLTAVGASAAGAQALLQVSKLLWLNRSDEFEQRASARLLMNDLSRLFVGRLVLLVGVMLAAVTGHPVPALMLAIGGEMLGRYLFFVSVVPRNMATPYLSARGTA